jgi:hypothetical protein
MKEYNCPILLVCRVNSLHHLRTCFPGIHLLCTSGKYQGVQARVCGLQPKAVFAYCSAHNLNLALQAAVNDSEEIKLTFHCLKELGAFFKRSAPRVGLLQNCKDDALDRMKELVAGFVEDFPNETLETNNVEAHVTGGTIKPLSETRWTVKTNSL